MKGIILTAGKGTRFIRLPGHQQAICFDLR
jgi:dTDP-glucose pyrophosphorylase